MIVYGNSKTGTPRFAVRKVPAETLCGEVVADLGDFTVPCSESAVWQVKRGEKWVTVCARHKREYDDSNRCTVCGEHLSEPHSTDCSRGD